MRPGGGIDILVRRKDVDACLNLLAKQGIDEFWPDFLKDEDFTRSQGLFLSTTNPSWIEHPSKEHGKQKAQQGA